MNAGVRSHRHYYTIDAEKAIIARQADRSRRSALANHSSARFARSARSSLSRCCPRSARSSTWRWPIARSCRRSRKASSPNGASSSFSEALISRRSPRLRRPPGRGAIAIVRASGEGCERLRLGIFSRAGRGTRGPRLAKLGNDRRREKGAIVDEPAGTVLSGAAFVIPARTWLELHVHGSPVVAREALASIFGGRCAVGVARRVHPPRVSQRQARSFGGRGGRRSDRCREPQRRARRARARLAGGLLAVVDGGQRARAVRRSLEELAGTLDFPEEVAGAAALAIGGRGWPPSAPSWHGWPEAGRSGGWSAKGWPSRSSARRMRGSPRCSTRSSGRIALWFRSCRGRRATRSRNRLGVEGVARASNRYRRHPRAFRSAGGRRGSARSEHAARGGPGWRWSSSTARSRRPKGAAADRILVRTREQPRVVVLFNKPRFWVTRGYEERKGAGERRCALMGESVSFPRSAPQTWRAFAEALPATAIGIDRPDLERPHLATVRQADCVLAASRALERALETLHGGQPIDLASGDLTEAAPAALGELSKRRCDRGGAGRRLRPLLHRQVVAVPRQARDADFI